MKVPRVVKFIGSGGVASVMEYGTFLIMYSTIQAFVPIFILQTISFLIGAIVSFTMNKFWVFEKIDNRRLVEELIKYLSLVAVNIILSNILLFILVDIASISIYFAKFIVMGAVAVWNYLIVKRFIFNTRNDSVA